jgi:hypothetical protein
LTDNTIQEPNVLNKPHLIVRGSKSFDLFAVFLSLTLLLILAFNKREFFLTPVLSFDYIFHVVLLLLFFVLSIFLCTCYFDKSPNLIIDTSGIYYKGLSLNRKKWRHLNWEDVESGYLSDTSRNGITDRQIVFTTRENNQIKIGISSYEKSEIQIMDIIERFSVIHKFGFLRDI